MGTAFCGPARDTLLSNRNTEKLNFERTIQQENLAKIFRNISNLLLSYANHNIDLIKLRCRSYVLIHRILWKLIITSILKSKAIYIYRSTCLGISRLKKLYKCPPQNIGKLL